MLTTVPTALPVAEVARLYGVHYTTIWRQVNTGGLPYVTIGKRKFILLPLPTYQQPDASPPLRHHKVHACKAIEAA
jgi:hypothetical protein